MTMWKYLKDVPKLILVLILAYVVIMGGLCWQGYQDKILGEKEVAAEQAKIELQQQDWGRRLDIIEKRINERNN